jgi:hypothetical protein
MNTFKSDFFICFAALKSILKKYENRLHILTDKSYAYNLNAGYDKKRKVTNYFGGVVINKNYVSFHLMPLYVNPILLKAISPELKRRMQGKSCFKFTRVDKTLFNELSLITKAGFEFYKKNGML